MEQEFDAIEREMLKRLHKEGAKGDDIKMLRYVDMRYLGQWRYLSVPRKREMRVSDLLLAFHNEHRREFAYSRPEQPVEIFGIRVTAIGRIPKPTLPKYQVDPSVKAEPRSRRPVYFSEAGGYVDTPVFHRDDLPAGFRFSGPAIVEQLDSTTVVPPGVQAEVDGYLNIIMRLTSQGV